MCDSVIAFFSDKMVTVTIKELVRRKQASENQINHHIRIRIFTFRLREVVFDEMQREMR